MVTESIPVCLGTLGQLLKNPLPLLLRFIQSLHSLTKKCTVNKA